MPHKFPQEILCKLSTNFRRNPKNYLSNPQRNYRGNFQRSSRNKILKHCRRNVAKEILKGTSEKDSNGMVEEIFDKIHKESSERPPKEHGVEISGRIPKIIARGSCEIFLVFQRQRQKKF